MAESNDQYVSYTPLKVWIASQEEYERTRGQPAPLTDKQRRAMAELLPPPVAPQITDDEAANVDWKSLLINYIVFNKSVTPEWKEMPVGEAHLQQWRVQCRLPREAPQIWFPPDVLGRRRAESSSSSNGGASNGSAGRRPVPVFGKKKEATQYAAQCAVKWLMANHYMPKDVSTPKFGSATTPLINSVEQPRVSNVYSPIHSPRASPRGSPEPAPQSAGNGGETEQATARASPTPQSSRHPHSPPSPSLTAMPMSKKRVTERAAEDTEVTKNGHSESEPSAAPAVPTASAAVATPAVPPPSTPQPTRKIKSMASPYKDKQAAATNGVVGTAAAGSANAGNDDGGAALGSAGTSASAMAAFAARKNTKATNGGGGGSGHHTNGNSETRGSVQPTISPGGDGFIPFGDSSSSGEDDDDEDDSNDIDIKSSPNVMALLMLCKSLNLGTVKYKLGKDSPGGYNGYISIRRPNGSMYSMPSSASELAKAEPTKVAARETLAKSVVTHLQTRVGAGGGL